MVQKIHPQGVILVPKLCLMWADHLKKLTAVPSIYKEVHGLGSWWFLRIQKLYSNLVTVVFNNFLKHQKEYYILGLGILGRCNKLYHYTFSIHEKLIFISYLWSFVQSKVTKDKGGFHLHLLVFPFVYQFNSRIGVLVHSSFAND